MSQIRRIQTIAPIETLQPPYSLVAREVEAELLPFALEHWIGVLAYAPMGSGLLTGAMTRERLATLSAGDWRRNNARFQEPALSRNLELVERLRQVADRHGVSPGAVAVAWVLRHPAVSAAIAGFRRPAQVAEVLEAATLALGPEDIALLG